ncbi:serine hydrolase domain-containing protein [Chelativorans salis]|uniref:Beta-lactamase family protein n=1 Tax=Chelativorans salis TaxID=2978478 RepID=A0ABT2LK64_9HYPH|nr:serine hydrolase [Chelativorans sp. EGI FJ00035]MCT7374991.1 beta-lactamase family protein [Chelativorans sp. EGI FJ00035]
MRIVLSIVKWLAGLLLVALLALVVWLWLAPPELIRVGASYTAKIVCSNVFLAGREADDVLREDVQAPGHPLLRLMWVRMDAEEGIVRTGLFGVFGNGLAVFRDGTGCAVVPDGDLAAVREVAIEAPAATSHDETALWPEGEGADTSRHPDIAALLEDPAIVGPGLRAAVVVHDGRIVGERYGAGDAVPGRPLLGWSMTKTVNAAIAGTVVGSGRLSVEEEGLLQEWAGDQRGEITLAHLLGLESGLAFNEDYNGVSDVTRMLYMEPDMAGFAANMPLLYRPGEHFSYSSGTSVILSRVWQNAFADEEEALAWPRRALFDPAGMETAVFETDARGTFVGSSYLYASARDWARFGQLLLQEGIWEGRQVLPEGWVEWMRTPTQTSDGEYGRGLWMQGPRVMTPRDRHQDDGFDLPDDAYWMLGHDGQTITIIPSRRLVVVRMGLTPTVLAYKPQILVEAVVKALDRGEE